MLLLENIIKQNILLMDILERARNLNVENYYIGAGCVAQSTWNYLCGNDLWFGIKDIDFVYFDQENTNNPIEKKLKEKIYESFSDIKIEIDIVNQASVHLWYKDYFGYPIKPYKSLESAIDTWPTTATALGVRLETDNTLKIYAPFRITDLLQMRIRANKVQITEEIYIKKVDNWIKKWPNLTIIPWEIE